MPFWYPAAGRPEAGEEKSSEKAAAADDGVLVGRASVGDGDAATVRAGGVAGVGVRVGRIVIAVPMIVAAGVAFVTAGVGAGVVCAPDGTAPRKTRPAPVMLSPRLLPFGCFACAAK